MSLNILFVEPLTINSIRVWFDTYVVVNDAFKNIDNFHIINADNIPLEIIQVVYTSEVVKQYINLYIRNQIEDKIYTITVNNLVNRAGNILINNTISWKYYRTKIDSLNSSLPRVYDKRPTSYLGQLTTAIGYSDNIIGGHPSDSSDAIIP